MALNKQVMVKLKEITAHDPNLCSFITALIQFESDAERGWYERQYSTLLEKHCKEVDK